MTNFSTFKKISLGISALSGTIWYLYSAKNGRNTVYASWTTNYTPSAYSKWDDNWDHRSPQFLVNPKTNKVNNGNNNKFKETIESVTPSTTRHLILIRHGQYRLGGRTDQESILTELGKTQAKSTGERLKELGFPYTTMVKSTMTRAQETGAIINSSLPNVSIKDCHLLREGAPVPPEPPVGHWKPEIHFYQDGARIEAAFREYFHRADASQEKDSYTVLVCHANVIRYFVCRALQFPPEAWLRFSLNHGSITWVSIMPSGRVVLRALGDTGHMRPELISN